MIAGLTGKSCAGKDTFASLLPDSFTIIDVDKLGHEALENSHQALREAFGPSIFTAEGRVDRKILGPLVFSDPALLELLNAITHPWMKERALLMAEDAVSRGKIAVINAALLESMGFVPYCDHIVLVAADQEVRERRAMERSGISHDEFIRRSAAQKDIGLSLFSSGRRVITIFNNGSLETLSRQVENYCGIIRKEA